MIKDDGTPLRLEELVVGGDIRMLGQEFFITDADEFTRQYFRYVLVFKIGVGFVLLLSVSVDN